MTLRSAESGDRGSCVRDVRVRPRERARSRTNPRKRPSRGRAAEWARRPLEERAGSAARAPPACCARGASELARLDGAARWASRSSRPRRGREVRRGRASYFADHGADHARRPSRSRPTRASAASSRFRAARRRARDHAVELPASGRCSASPPRRCWPATCAVLKHASNVPGARSRSRTSCARPGFPHGVFRTLVLVEADGSPALIARPARRARSR